MIPLKGGVLVVAWVGEARGKQRVGEDKERMSTKLFVGGLSWGTSDAGLLAAFLAFGDVVEAKIVLDRETGRSRGFGFVTFATEQAAAQAIEAMHGKELDGRMLTVNAARERSAPVRRNPRITYGRARGAYDDRDSARSHARDRGSRRNGRRGTSRSQRNRGERYGDRW